MKTPLYAVVMAGGRGTRFWPLSRAHRPKQLLSLLTPKTLLRETVDRILPICSPENVLVVTVAEQFNAVREELSFLPRRNFLVEPKGNNTAPCIGLAALEIERRHSGSIMAILPADHWIATGARFRRTLRRACRIAARYEGLLVTLGVAPRYAETGFGYIIKGLALSKASAPGAFQVKRFKEKPSRTGANRIIKAGGLWNSGIFVWRAAAILERFKECNTEIAEALGEMSRELRGRSLTGHHKRTRAALAKCYEQMPSISIDHAVLERAATRGQVVTLEADFRWDDVGSWSALHQLLDHDPCGHGGHGRWLSVDSSNCLLFGHERLLVLLGVKDLAVIDTPDAVLVANLERSQDLKAVVERLATGASTRHLL